MQLEENMQIKRVKNTKCMKCMEKQGGSFQPIILFFLVIGLAILSGCIYQKPEVVKVNPEIYEDQVVYTNLSNAVGIFAVIKGNIPQVKETYEEIIVNKTAQQSTFSVDDDMNFVVSRGITPGFDININKVEKQGNVYTVYATYIDQGTDLGILSHPIAIIPIGKLAAGDYEARLRVTRVLNTLEGRKVIETEKEMSVFNFKIKTPEKVETGTTQTQKTIFVMNGTIENITIPCPFNVQCNPQYWLDAEDGNTYHLLISSGKRLPDGSQQICEGSLALQEQCLTRVPNQGQHIEVIGIETNETDCYLNYCEINGTVPCTLIPCQPIGTVDVSNWQPR